MVRKQDKPEAQVVPAGGCKPASSGTSVEHRTPLGHNTPPSGVHSSGYAGAYVAVL